MYLPDQFRALWSKFCIRWKRWRLRSNALFDKDIMLKELVVIKSTGDIAVVDHIKSDGILGIRPIDPKMGTYLPNMSKHWSWDDRIRIPHEVALHPNKVRRASPEEIPMVIRR